MHDRAVAEQVVPTGGGKGLAVEAHTGLTAAEQAAGSCHHAARADDAVADDGAADRRSGDGVRKTGRGRLFFFDPDTEGNSGEAPDEVRQIPMGNTDHQDRFIVFQKERAGDDGVEIDPGDNVDGLARVADRADGGQG